MSQRQAIVGPGRKDMYINSRVLWVEKEKKVKKKELVPKAMTRDRGVLILGLKWSCKRKALSISRADGNRQIPASPNQWHLTRIHVPRKSLVAKTIYPEEVKLCRWGLVMTALQSSGEDSFVLEKQTLVFLQHHEQPLPFLLLRESARGAAVFPYFPARPRPLCLQQFFIWSFLNGSQSFLLCQTVLCGLVSLPMWWLLESEWVVSLLTVTLSLTEGLAYSILKAESREKKEMNRKKK